MAPGIRGHAVGYSRSTRAISSSALGRSVPLSGSDVDAASYVSSFDVVVPMALSRSVAQSLSALYCVEKLRAKPAGDGARADDAGFGGPPRATDTASPALYDDAGWVNPTERPSMRGRHCAGLTGCNTKNCPLRKTSQENRRNGNAFSDPSKPNFSRDMREKGRYDDNGRHFRRCHGGAEVGDGRISAARVSAGSRGEARFYFDLLAHTTVGAKVFHSCLHVRIADLFEKLPSTSSKVRVYLPRLPGSTPDLRGDPPRDFRSRFVTSSELREIRLRFEAGSHGSKHQLWNPPLERGPSLPTSCPRRKPCFEASHDVYVSNRTNASNERIKTNESHLVLNTLSYTRTSRHHRPA